MGILILHSFAVPKKARGEGAIFKQNHVDVNNNKVSFYNRVVMEDLLNFENHTQCIFLFL